MAKKKTPDFCIKLELGDKTYAGTGATAFEALQAVPKPDKMMGKGILTISHGEKSHQQLLWPMRLKRLFYGKHFQEIQAKQLAVSLK